jgi:flagellar biosynthesis/type III secretory pathway protein FliH
MSIIKATDRARGIQPVAFNFDDMAVKATSYLDGVRQQADQVVNRAQQQAEQTRQRIEEESRQKGYADGQQEVQQIVEKKLGEQLATLLPALAATIQEIQHAKQAWMTHWERSAVQLATAIAERIVRREIEQKPEITVGLVRESLELAAGSSTVRVLLNPKDHETLQPRAEALIHDMAGLGACDLVADPSVTAGGCRVETAFGTIDQQIETQLQRIEQELT